MRINGPNPSRRQHRHKNDSKSRSLAEYDLGYYRSKLLASRFRFHSLFLCAVPFRMGDGEMSECRNVGGDDDDDDDGDDVDDSSLDYHTERTR